MLLYRILEALMAKYERIIMRHYCSPFYGSQLSDLSNKHIEKYCTNHRTKDRPTKSSCSVLPGGY